MGWNDESCVVVTIENVFWVSSIIDDALEEDNEDGKCALEEDEEEEEAERWIFVFFELELYWCEDELVDDDEWSLWLALLWCRSSNERKNARAFSTALLADAECWNFRRDSEIPMKKKTNFRFALLFEYAYQVLIWNDFQFLTFFFLV